MDRHVDADRIHRTCGVCQAIDRALHDGDRLGVVLQDDTYPTALAAVDPEHAHQRALAASISRSFTTARSSRASFAPGPLRMRLQ